MNLLDAKGVSILLGNTPVLSALTFSLGAGELVGLIGPNGAGKTTLLRLLAGFLSPQSGQILFNDRPLQEVDRFERARRLAFLPQEHSSSWAVTVETLVTMGRLPHRGPWRGLSKDDKAAVARAIELCDVGHLIARPVTTLSGGERARVLLARALAVEPKILLADEPVSGLDPAHQLDVMRMLRGLAAAGAGVIVVMHDLTLAARFCHRLAILHDGAIMAQGSPATVLSAENLARYYGVRAYRDVAEGEAIIVPLERVPAGADHVSR